MFDPGIIPVVQALIDADVATVDRAGLAEVVRASERVRAWLDAGDVATARRAKELARADPSSTSSKVEAREMLSNQGRRSDRDARTAAGRAELCEQMPGFESALLEGRIGAGHVDAMAAATRGLSPGERSAVGLFQGDLLDAAAGSTVAEFGRRARELVETCVRRDDPAERLDRQRRRRRMRRWTDDETGMWKLLVELDPVTGAKVSAAIDAKVSATRQRERSSNADGVRFEHLEVDALVELVCATGGEDPDLRRVPEVCVHVDAPSLFHGATGGLCELVEGIAVPVDMVRRWCCDADIVPIVFDADGNPIDAGRSRRTANRKQRRLLRARYRTCGYPGCGVGFDRCEIHHVIPWERFGPSDIANLLPLCPAHHHLVHEGGWNLSMTSDRVVTVRDPSGGVTHQGSTCSRPAPPGSSARAPARQNDRADAGEPGVPTCCDGRVGR